MKKINIAGVDFNPLTLNQLKEFIGSALKSGKQHKIVKANGEFLHRALNSPEFAETMNSAELCIADGAGIIWADRYLSLEITKNKILKPAQAFFQLLSTGITLFFNQKNAYLHFPERLSGIEVFNAIMVACADKRSPVFYFGARKEILEKAVKVIKKKHPNLMIADYVDGYGDKGDRIIRKINESGAKLLIVALGSPEQEYWIRDNINKLKNINVAVGEGGSFDAIAGAAIRAPKIFQKLNIEWLWRAFTIKNLTNNAPHRIKRVINAVPLFMYAIMKWKIKNGS